MKSIELTDAIEQKILATIDSAETDSLQNKSTLAADYYIQLADHYHFNKQFQRETEILRRYARFENTNGDELVDIYERIDRAAELAKLNLKVKVAADGANSKASQASKTANGWSLAEDQESEEITIGSNARSAPQNRSISSAFRSHPVRVLSVCAVFTGRNDDDEVVQLALVLTEFDSKKEPSWTTLEKFTANRKPLKSIPEKTAQNFALNQSPYESRFDRAKIISIFKRAELIVSHNDADIERKLIATLIPEVAHFPWYSSQKDIPWRALGFESKSLSDLARSLGEKKPRTSLERAVTISRILQMDEPSESQSYLERLYNARPMKIFEWTASLTRQKYKIKYAKLILGLKLSAMLLLLTGLAFYIGLN